MNKNINFKRTKNSDFTKREILNVLILLTINGLFIESAVGQLLIGDKKVPSADTVLRTLEEEHWTEILEQFKTINKEIYRSAIKQKPFKEIHVRGTYLAIDYHKIPRYRKNSKKPNKKKRGDDFRKAIGTNGLKGTKFAHKIGTIDVVGEKYKFTLDFHQYFTGTAHKTVVRELLKNAKEVVKKIKATLCDREFFNVEVINEFKEDDDKYLIPAKKNNKIKKILKEVKRDNLQFHITPYTLKNVKKEKADTTLVFVNTNILKTKKEWKDSKLLQHRSYFIYSTNLEVNAENYLEIAELYRIRWGIETGYRDKKGFRGKTCSLWYSVRLTVILLSITMSNIWIYSNVILDDNKELQELFGNHMTGFMFRFCLMLVFVALYFPDIIRDLLLSVDNFHDSVSYL